MSALRVVIVEDEATVARRIARLTTEILGPGETELTFARSIADARALLATTDPDLLILDLNLGEEEGFALLRDSWSQTFETVVVSAHADRALDAFEYGVRDFVPKPFDRDRLEVALRRAIAFPRPQQAARSIGIRKHGRIEMVATDDILYVEGAGTRSVLVLRNGRRISQEKLLDRMAGVLPSNFERIHKSYILDVRAIRQLETHEGSRYRVVLEEGTVLPVGRTRVQALRRRLR